MNFILSDFNNHQKFLPLSFTKSIADFRAGILTIKEKWEFFLKQKVSIYTQDYLQEKYNLKIDKENIIINSQIIPNHDLVEDIINLKNSCLVKNGNIIAYACLGDLDSIPETKIEFKGDILIINSNTDIFTLNSELIKQDFEIITKTRKSQKLSPTNTVFGNYPIFVEDNCFVECASFNTNEGPIYIGKNSKIMEGSNIRGPFAICENSEIKMGAKIYGATTIGPNCKVGGEINNSVFFAYSNKAHDGFLGNAVIGEWCNIGADSNNSNLKNNYAIVKLWDYEKEKFLSTGLQFCGLIMGDHSKCAINTMFNTGTVIGVSANIFGAGFPRNFIPSFSWGGHAGLSVYKTQTAFEVMEKVMKRRNLELTEADKRIFKHIFDITAKYRRF
ncbi:MAG: glucose-1-phosphate thymidylyltransferase [Bacteroidales bacterium]|jgi:UDP-N-acetylglucosamine diphosphorylase/glucosamine-1-phosphate N-acetyltransferase|nr:GlmU family protein [Bacteroidales bacterium]MCK9500047.1 GlmU family protein [Bacteroidales bacterium]MDY0314348.1 GlmU family protein [Bacteroidales bacterium]NLB86339.1 glucose-1-phosphate thymidylyltransferase [Bacteroidales bacterium]